MKSLHKNAIMLLIAHVAGYVIPLLEVPILARNLGPDSYGKVIFFYSFAFLSSLIVEYGFNLSASRQVAIIKDNQFLLRKIFSDVLLAKILLCLVTMLFITLIIKLASMNCEFVIDYKMTFWSVVYFFAFGFSPFWYFQGNERMTLAIAIDFFLRFAGILMQFLFVKNASDACLAIAIMSSVGLANTLITTSLCLLQIGFAPMSFRGAMSQLSQGFNVFIYRSSNNILLSAAPTVLGAVAGQIALASFVPAEKIIRGVAGFVTPILTAFFPHNARNLAGRANMQALRDTWTVIFLIALAGICFSVILWFLGPGLINFVLGKQYDSSVELLKLFVWVIPFRMTNQALGIMLIIPTKRDRAAGVLLSFFSIFSLVLGGGLASFWGSLGMVIGFLVAELMLFISLFFVSLRITQEFGEII